MQTVEDLLNELEKKGEEAFLARFDHPVLLYPSGHGPGTFQTFHTRMASRVHAVQGRQERLLYKDFQVLLPVFSGKGPCPEKLLIGRSADRDFTIDHSSVSKRHAFIVFESDKAAYRLGDAGSTNGTFLNGDAVESGMPVYLRDGNTVSFGDCDYLFYSPRGLLELLGQVRLNPELSPIEETPPLIDENDL
ncbi:MAG TPA: FHA domain-containing protein [Myxococcota bacterium]|nr:FHA domain-containing protein [Myxococcota bacterium]HRY92330.1 FHA domain-containing protein [Myxococcota bacterium]HSA22977.1 FHA domain-containing protein [Myxococcota bacterium]